MTNEERRAEPRVKAEGLLSVTLRSGDQETECHLVDISAAGVYLATSARLDPGIRVTLVFPPQATEVHARVVRAKTSLDGHHDALPAGLGLTFLADTDEEQERVRAVVAGIVSADLLSYDRQKSSWMTSTESGGRDRTKPFKP